MHFPALHVPSRLLEHPIESFLAGLLLLALLFVSTDPPAKPVSLVHPHIAGAKA